MPLSLVRRSPFRSARMLVGTPRCGVRLCCSGVLSPPTAKRDDALRQAQDKLGRPS